MVLVWHGSNCCWLEGGEVDDDDDEEEEKGEEEEVTRKKRTKRFSSANWSFGLLTPSHLLRDMAN